MESGSARAVVERAVLGSACVLAAGFLTFGFSPIRPGDPALIGLLDGPLTAIVLALVRSSRTAQAVVLASSFAFVRSGLAVGVPWRPVLSGMLLGAGVLLIATIFHRLAESGLRFGKALVTAPLTAGLYVALVPLGQPSALNALDPMGTLPRLAWLGLVVGGGAALGVEIADRMLPTEAAGEPAERRPPAAPESNERS